MDVRALGLAFVATSCLAAQSVGPGLTWTGTSGPSTGSFFPSCQNLPVAAMPGDTVTLRVWGDPGSLFVVGVAASASQCLPIPGIGNALVLDLPASPVWSGILTQLTPCLACPPGYEALTLLLPPTLPTGTGASLQAVGFGNGLLTLSVAITATVP
ncbi:MAG: hypothetical protein WAT39_09800 [Planctomycetota bacterium]